MIAYCIGNGPSLTAQDLNFISDNMKDGDVSFASNHIHLMFPHTYWRPDFWVTVETPTFYPIFDNMIEGCRVYLTTNRAEKVESYRPAFRRHEYISYLKPCEHLWQVKKEGKHPPNQMRFGEKDHQICMYGGSGVTAIQLAILGGYDPVVLVGHDVIHTLEAHHFTPEYNDNDWPAWLTPQMRTDTLMDAHEKLSITAREKWNTSIVNCTTGGILECYPRKSLEEAILCHSGARPNGGTCSGSTRE